MAVYTQVLIHPRVLGDLSGGHGHYLSFFTTTDSP